MDESSRHYTEEKSQKNANYTTAFIHMCVYVCVHACTPKEVALERDIIRSMVYPGILICLSKYCALKMYTSQSMFILLQKLNIELFCL